MLKSVLNVPACADRAKPDSRKPFERIDFIEGMDFGYVFSVTTLVSSSEAVLSSCNRYSRGNRIASGIYVTRKTFCMDCSVGRMWRAVVAKVIGRQQSRVAFSLPARSVGCEMSIIFTFSQ